VEQGRLFALRNCPARNYVDLRDLGLRWDWPPRIHGRWPASAGVIDERGTPFAMDRNELSRSCGAAWLCGGHRTMDSSSLATASDTPIRIQSDERGHLRNGGHCVVGDRCCYSASGLRPCCMRSGFEQDLRSHRSKRLVGRVRRRHRAPVRPEKAIICR